LADPAVTEAWLAAINAQPGLTAVALHQNEPKKINGLIQIARSLSSTNRSTNAPTTAMVVGIPNCGKSTLINRLVGRKVAATSNKPAVTRKQQRIRVYDDFWLLDTPGMLWPKLSPPECGYWLAVTGAIRDGVLDFEGIACFAARYLLDTYPAAIAKRYNLTDMPSDEIDLLNSIGRRRGCIGRGGRINLEKVAELLIQDIRKGALDRISFERP
jgi:ribosome biogenesis GTPase A